MISQPVKNTDLIQNSYYDELFLLYLMVAKLSKVLKNN